MADVLLHTIQRRNSKTEKHWREISKRAIAIADANDQELNGTGVTGDSLENDKRCNGWDKIHVDRQNYFSTEKVR